MWLVLMVFLILDFLVLKRTYPLGTILKSFLGFFPEVDIYTSLNSPLWYFTLILFYYLIFPLLFFRKRPILSVFLILLASYYVLKFNLPVNKDVLKLYKLHYLAFPLGMGVALSLRSFPRVRNIIEQLKPWLRYPLIAGLLVAFGYLAIHSRVGDGIRAEQLTSLASVLCLVLVALLKTIRFQFLGWLGEVSYEIYLIQWPLMYRFDFLYQRLPAGIATFLYLGVFLGLGFGLKKIIDLTTRTIPRRSSH